jgi:DNA transformation protein
VDPEAIRDLFAGLGPIRTRRMFGGQGIYSGEVMFGLEAGGDLYLKTDESTLPAFHASGSRPFQFEREGRLMQTSYWRLPDSALDDADAAARWGRSALEAALRAAQAKRVKRRPAARR